VTGRPADDDGLPTFLVKLLDASFDLPLRHRMAARPTATARRSAVLILFGEGPEGPDVLLIEKSAHLRRHAGQPAFPGGGADPGDDYPVGTALREAQEEAGVDPDGVRVLATLPELFLGPSDNLVVPVVAWWDDPAEVAVGDPREVARVARVPLDELADPAHRFRVGHPSGYVGPAFGVADMVVWGFTAALLDAILEASGLARPWNHDDVRPLPLPGARAAALPGGRRRADGRRSTTGRPSDAYGHPSMNLHQGPPTARLQGPAARLRAAGGRGVLFLVVGMLAAGALVGCGAGGSAGATATTAANASLGKVTTGPGGVQEVTIQTGDDYVFTPNHFTVHPGEVRLTVTNVGNQISHNFRFTPDKGPQPIAAQILLLPSGTKRTIDFAVSAPGDYPFECSFHVDLGQVGTMTVAG
jgi:8-oxo-dGTP pyrophosphatase MutT (NUDIX family)/plastocyanin